MLLHNGQILLQQRPKEGLLARLWQFYLVDDFLPPEEAEPFLSSRGFAVSRLQPLGEHKHLFSHIEWQMTGYLAELSALPSLSPNEVLSSRWALLHQYPLPSAFAPYTAALLSQPDFI